MGISIGIVIALIVYGGVLAIISKIGARKTGDSAEGFFIGGRDIPAFVLLGTMLMTLWQAGSAYGWPGSSYRNGVGFISGAAGTFFMCFMSPCLMYPMWLLGKKYNYVTPTDIITHRYRSRPLTLLFAGISIVFLIPFIAVQIIAVSNGADVTTNKMFPYALIVAFMTIYIFAHVIGGGTNNVVLTDVFAGFVGLGIFLTFTFFIVKNVLGPLGGVGAQTRTFLAENPDIISHSGNYGSWFNVLGLSISAGCGVIMWPYVMNRAFMARSPKAFKVQAIAMPLLVCLNYSNFLFIGIWGGRAGLPGLEGAVTDSIVPMLALKYTPTILCSLMVVAVFAYGLSTADSQLITISSIVERDIYKEQSKKINKKRIYAWLAAMLVGILLIVAFRPTLLVNYAYLFSSPGFVQMGPAILGGIFWKRATKEGATAGTLVGLIAVLFVLFVKNPIPSMNPVNWGLLFNIPVFILVSLMTRPNKEAVEEVPVFLARFFKERNNSNFKFLIFLVIAVFAQDILTVYMPNPIVLGWVPFHLFNHWLVAVECAVLGFLFSKNRFGPLPGKTAEETAELEMSYLK